jgi:DNA replication protein DnaC
MLPTTPQSLAMLLRALKLPTIARQAAEVARQAERDAWTFEKYLHHVVELEVHERHRSRIERHLKASDLPREKTLATLTRSRTPTKIGAMLPTLCQGGFVDRGDNLLVFGLPGRGKSHLVAAIGHELVQHGYRVFFTPTYALVQRLLAAKRDLRLEKELALLDAFDAVILDDLGYVQQSRDEMEVLFTFLAERYERRTVIITSNLVFSEWDRIFKDPMTTAAAIDRLVHHSVILEMSGKSIRAEAALARQTGQGGTPPPTESESDTPIAPTSEAPTPSPPASRHPSLTPTLTRQPDLGARPPASSTTTTPTSPKPEERTRTQPATAPTTTTHPKSPKNGAPATTTPTKRPTKRDHATTNPDGEM